MRAAMNFARSGRTYRFFPKATSPRRPVVPAIRPYSCSSILYLDDRPLLDLREIDVRQPSDLGRASKQAISKIQFIREALKSHVTGSHPLPETTRRLELLDAISNELCLAIDSAEFIRNTHQDGDYQQAAGEVFSELHSLIADLNADKNLFNILKEIIENKSIFSALSEDDQHVALDLLRDFKLEGIHLSDSDRQTLQDMNQQVSEIESQWSANIIHSGSPNTQIETPEQFEEYYVAVGPFPKADDDNFQNLSRWAGRQVQQPSDAVQAKVLILPREQRALGMATASVQNDELRQQLWWEYSLTPRENVITLPALLQQRHQLAKFLGYEHYAQKMLLKSACKNIDAVRDLIKTLSTAARPYAQENLTLLRARKLYLAEHGHSATGSFSAGLKNFFSSVTTSSSSSSSPARQEQLDRVVLQPWDIAYLQSQSIPTELLGLPSSTSSRVDPAEYDRAVRKIKEYFPVSRCLEGLALVTESLFGVRLVQDDVQPGEIWLHEHRQPGDILKFHLLDDLHPSSSSSSSSSSQRSQLLGTVYIDMFRRPHKFPGAAHFTVRCGCDTVEYDYSGVVSPFSASSYDTAKWRPKAQTPIVALVFPFHPPSSDGAGSKVRGMSFTAGYNATALANHCLSLSDVETLFHEWGHALHSLLSKSKYQHHSGTRGFTDFVEIPSHLFEHFARDPQVIRQWAKHHITGESIPLPLLETALSGKANNQGFDLQVQIALSLADQYLLSDPTLTAALNNNPQLLHSDRDQRRFFLQAMEGITALQMQYTDLPVAALSSVTANGPAASQQWLQSALDNPADAASFRLPYMPMLAHRHFVGYAGTYHSYLYAKVVAAQIWDRLFVSTSSTTTTAAAGNSVLSREMGLHLRRELLAKGSSRPAELLLSRLLQKSPSMTSESRAFEVDPDPYLRMMMRGLA